MENPSNQVKELKQLYKKKSPEEIKNFLKETEAFISIEKILQLCANKKMSQVIYNELKNELSEFYIIIYKKNLIKCGWSTHLDPEETLFYCKALDKNFILSKNKIKFLLVNSNPKFKDKVNQQINNITTACNQNN